MADGGDRSLVEADANFASAAADVTSAACLAAVVVEGRQTDEGGDRLTGALAELREVTISRGLAATPREGT